MAKFKHGDRVRLIEANSYGGPKPGAEGTVVEVSTAPGVQWDGFEYGHDHPTGDGGKSCWYVAEKYLAPINAEYAVLRMHSGGLFERPLGEELRRDYADAVTVAERYAHASQEIYKVFKLVHTVKVVTTTTLESTPA